MSDELYLHFEHKNAPEFWKTWNAKVRKNVTKRVNINGKVNDTDVANEFALHFKNAFYNSYEDNVASLHLCI